MTTEDIIGITVACGYLYAIAAFFLAGSAPIRSTWPLAASIAVWIVWPLVVLVMLPHRVVVRLCQPTRKAGL